MPALSLILPKKVHHLRLVVGGCSSVFTSVCLSVCLSARRLHNAGSSRVYGIFVGKQNRRSPPLFLPLIPYPLPPPFPYPPSLNERKRERERPPFISAVGAIFCRCSPERRAVALHILNISERIHDPSFRPYRSI